MKNIFQRKEQPNAFTLTELVVVMLVLAALLAFAIPRFLTSAEHGRAGEAISNLGAVYASQERYRLEHGTYMTALEGWDALDIQEPKENIFQYQAYNATGIPNTTGMVIRNGLLYELLVFTNGRILCRPGPDVASRWCPKIGCNEPAGGNFFCN